MIALPKARFCGLLAAAAVAGCISHASAGLMVTAEVYDTPGLPGFQTFDLTLQNDGGAFVSLAFDPAIGGGITGPLHQSLGYMGTMSQHFDNGLDAGNRSDSRFLMRPGSENLVFNDNESEGHLSGVFGTFGPHLDYAATEVPFVRLVTNSPSDVRVLGSVGVVANRGTTPQTHSVDFRLSDLVGWEGPLSADAAADRREADRLMRLDELSAQINAAQRAKDEARHEGLMRAEQERRAEWEAQRQAEESARLAAEAEYQAQREAEAEARRIARGDIDPDPAGGVISGSLEISTVEISTGNITTFPSFSDYLTEIDVNSIETTSIDNRPTLSGRIQRLLEVAQTTLVPIRLTGLGSQLVELGAPTDARSQTIAEFSLFRGAAVNGIAYDGIAFGNLAIAPATNQIPEPASCLLALVAATTVRVRRR